MDQFLFIFLAICLKLSHGIRSAQDTYSFGSNPNSVLSIASMVCIVEDDLSEINIQWRHGNETFTNMSTGRHRVVNGINEQGLNFTTLFINPVSYQDNGQYYCDAIGPSGNVTDEINLVLHVHLMPGNNSTDIYTNAASVELNCDMAGYVPPNTHLRWYRNNSLIEDTNRYSTVYRPGSYRAQQGGNTTSNSVLGVLIIASPTLNDTGEFECRVSDYDLAHTLQLNVKQLSQTQGPTLTPSSTVDPNAPSNNNQLLTLIIAIVAGCLGLIVIILLVVIIVVACNRCRQSEVFVHEQPTGNTTVTYIPTPTDKEQVDIGIKETAPPPVPTRTYSQSGRHNSRGEPELPDLIQSQRHPKSPPRHQAQHNVEPSFVDHSNKPRIIPPDHSLTTGNNQGPPPVARKPRRTYYDSVSMLLKDKPGLPGASGFSLQSVPSPHDVLSGSLQREQAQNPPDFTYPIYQDGFTPEDLAPYDTVENDYDQIYSEPIEPGMLNAGAEASDEALPYSAIYDDPKPLGQTEAPLQVTADNVVEIRKLGNGQFGQVILARTKNLSLVDLKLSETSTDRSHSILVAVKKLKTNAETGLFEAFDKEVKFMSRLTHDNVVRLLAVCKVGESFIMMEYMENGDLNQFLQKHSLVPDTVTGLGDWEITPIILLYIGVQISSGMHYLGSRRFVHRDLATRNCLVGKDFVVKISDFGMSRRLYESAYYRVQGTLVLPIRWMSCETFYGKFSVKSDAWAFGVTLWEVYTLASCDPYDEMSDEEVIQDAIRGPNRKLLPRPDACPRDVYDVMLRCWVHDPAMRADFGEIYSRLYMTYTSQAL